MLSLVPRRMLNYQLYLYTAESDHTGELSTIYFLAIPTAPHTMSKPPMVVSVSNPAPNVYVAFTGTSVFASHTQDRAVSTVLRINHSRSPRWTGPSPGMLRSIERHIPWMNVDQLRPRMHPGPLPSFYAL